MKLVIVTLCLAITVFGGLQFASAQVKGSFGTAEKPKVVEEEGFLGELNLIYTLGLALVGLSALFYIIWGGIMYIYAGENASVVGEAKSKIHNALWGILIAALSYAILYTINPDLVSLKLRLSETVQKFQEEVKQEKAGKSLNP